VLSDDFVNVPGAVNDDILSDSTGSLIGPIIPPFAIALISGYCMTS
jgi:hypothetical protein